MVSQRTLKSLTRAVGVGVHGGQRVELTFRPAPPDSGIVFRRVDLPSPVAIKVSADSVSDTRIATTISAGFDPPAVNSHGRRFVFDMGSGQYRCGIARARTFGFTTDVELMRSRGLGLGGSMNSAIVSDDVTVLNGEGRRYDGEFVKHKILD